MVVNPSQAAGFTPALARRSAYNADSIRNFAGFYLCDAASVKLSMGKVLLISFPDIFVIFVCPYGFESSLFKAEIKPTGTGKQRDDIHDSTLNIMSIASIRSAGLLGLDILTFSNLRRLCCSMR